MSEQPAQEPTMEEILASIRRIISEDEAPADEGASVVPEAEDEPAPAPPAPTPTPAPVAAVVEDEVLELTEKVETHGDIDAISPPHVAEPASPPVHAAAAPPEPAAAPEPLVETLVSTATASAAASAFGQLSANIGMPAEGLTLSDTVRELLRPLLKEWLDNNLADIVQATVAAEVERIARTR